MCLRALFLLGSSVCVGWGVCLAVFVWVKVQVGDSVLGGQAAHTARAVGEYQPTTIKVQQCLVSLAGAQCLWFIMQG